MSEENSNKKDKKSVSGFAIGVLAALAITGAGATYFLSNADDIASDLKTPTVEKELPLPDALSKNQNEPTVESQASETPEQANEQTAASAIAKPASETQLASHEEEVGENLQVETEYQKFDDEEETESEQADNTENVKAAPSVTQTKPRTKPQAKPSRSPVRTAKKTDEPAVEVLKDTTTKPTLTTTPSVTTSTTPTTSTVTNTAATKAAEQQAKIEAAKREAARKEVAKPTIEQVINGEVELRPISSGSRQATNTETVPAPRQVAPYSPNAKTASTPTSSATKSAGRGKRVVVQAGAYQSTSEADAQQAKLRAAGIESRVVKAQVKGKTYYRVQTDNLDSGQAAQVRQTLNSRGIDNFQRPAE